MMGRREVGRATLVVMIVLIVSALTTMPAAAFPGPAAQGNTRAQSAVPVIETAELRLWPEYDDPGVLVILFGSFGITTSFPLNVALPVPTGVRNVQATYQDANGALINRPFEVKDGKLAYELPSAGFHTEFYVDRAPSLGEQRNITYTFEAPYAINALRVSVQQPARASGFSLTPPAETTSTGTDGLTYHIFNRRNVAAGEKVEIQIAYSKSDSGLSAAQLAVTTTGAPAAASQPAGSAAGTSAPAAAGSADDVLPWVLIGLGVVLLAGILTYWLMSQRRQAAPAPATRTIERGSARAVSRSVRPTVQAVRPRPTVPARPGEDVGSFCTSCGNTLKSEDRFCSQCGTPRRS